MLRKLSLTIPLLLLSGCDSNYELTQCGVTTTGWVTCVNIKYNLTLEECQKLSAELEPITKGRYNSIYKCQKAGMFP